MPLTCIGTLAHADAPLPQPGVLIMATFKIRQLSDRSRDDEEHVAICGILRQFDFIALQ